MTARLRVRVRPGARRQRIVGWHADGSLRIEVLAPPEGGRANEAVIRLLSEHLGIGRMDVVVARGATSRSKEIHVKGLTEDVVTRRLELAMGERQGGQ